MRTGLFQGCVRLKILLLYAGLLTLNLNPTECKVGSAHPTTVSQAVNQVPDFGFTNVFTKTGQGRVPESSEWDKN